MVFIQLAALGAYQIFGPWVWTLNRGLALIKFSPFSARVVCLFCNKTIKLITKREEVTKQGFCKIFWRKPRLWGRVSYLIVLVQFQFKSHCHWSGWGWSGGLFEFDWEGVGLRLALILKLFLLLGWRLFEVDANSRLGAYSNKYGIKYRAAISTIEGHFSQVKLKLHKLWRTAQWQIFKLHPVFLKILWLFGLEGQLENLDWTGLDFFF